MYYHGCAEVRLCENFTFLNPLNSGQKVWWRMLFEAEQNVPKYTVNSCCLEAENHAYRVGVYTHSKFQDNVLVYNQWHWPLHLYLFFPLLWFVCLFFFSPPFPPCFCLLVTLVSRYPFDNCQSTITWMSVMISTIQLDTDCICLGHLATILITNCWHRNLNFCENFLH